MERKEAIERLKQLKLDYTEFWEEIKNETTEALDMAIASLKTDEAYQLEYENRDCVEVVRCSDCEHWKLFEDSSVHYCIPTHRFSGTNEYCSLGIKKGQTDGNDD